VLSKKKKTEKIQQQQHVVVKFWTCQKQQEEKREKKRMKKKKFNVRFSVKHIHRLIDHKTICATTVDVHVAASRHDRVSTPRCHHVPSQHGILLYWITFLILAATLRLESKLTELSATVQNLLTNSNTKDVRFVLMRFRTSTQNVQPLAVPRARVTNALGVRVVVCHLG
jgi:hypothetical protein